MRPYPYPSRPEVDLRTARLTIRVNAMRDVLGDIDAVDNLEQLKATILGRVVQLDRMIAE